MQAGRELDMKVAEALGWNFSTKRRFWRTTDGARVNEWELPAFSMSWNGMGVLVEEARKQGILIDIETMEDKYKVKAYRWNDFTLEYDEIGAAEGEAVPQLASEVFMQGKRTEK